MPKANFIIKKWNGEYGNKSVFVVEDTKTNKQSLFTPGRMSDLTWVSKDLAADHKKWQDFENEPIDNLSDVAF